MSNFTRVTKNPRTGEFEKADWLDSHFGPHHYGIRFPDGEVFNQRDHRWEFANGHKVVHHEGGKT
jgi:hypothetical protein